MTEVFVELALPGSAKYRFNEWYAHEAKLSPDIFLLDCCGFWCFSLSLQLSKSFIVVISF